MPTYDYHCSMCDKTFEAVRRIAVMESAECPDCGRMGSKQLSFHKVVHCVFNHTTVMLWVRWLQGRNTEENL